jgi:PadR family transcriptional regulator PadR
MGAPRLTGSVVKVLAALRRAGGEGAYGREIAADARVSSTTIYDVLLRIERAGWVSSRWEDVEPSAAGRPRRRLYQLTGAGEAVALDAVERELSALQGVRASRQSLGKATGARA